MGFFEDRSSHATSLDDLTVTYYIAIANRSLIVVGKDALEYKVVDNILGGVRNGILDGEEGNNILDGEEGNNRLVGVGSILVVVDYNKWERNVRRNGCFHLSCRRSLSSIHQAQLEQNH